MKFSVPTKEFMNALDRVTVIAKKKTRIQIFEYIKITANQVDNTVTMETQQIDEHLKISVPGVNVIEGGFAFINYNETKYIKVKDSMLMVECSEEKYFTISTGKKKCELIAENDRYEKEMPEAHSAALPAIRVDKSDLLETFKNVAVGLSDNPNKPVYQSYFLDPKHHAIVTCDGFIMVKRNVEWDFVKEDYSGMLIRGIDSGYLTNLKKIVDHKTKETIEIRVSEDGKYGAFVGGDFEYTFMLTEGEFFDYSLAIDPVKEENLRFKLNIPAAYETFKEFADIDSHMGKGAIIAMIGGNLTVGFGTDRFRTMEILEYTGEISENFVKKINPHFMSRILGVLKNDSKIQDHIVITSDNSLKPIYIQQGEYECMIVPIRMKDEHSEVILTYMKKSA